MYLYKALECRKRPRLIKTSYLKGNKGKFVFIVLREKAQFLQKHCGFYHSFQWDQAPAPLGIHHSWYYLTVCYNETL